MIGRKSFLVYFNQIFGAVTGLLGMFFIARFMAQPSYNYGIVNFALGFAGLFSFIGNLFTKAHVKRLSGGKDEGRCMGTFISLTTLSVAVMLALAFGGVLIWKYGLGRGFESPTHETVLYIILAFTAIKLMGKIGVTTFQAKTKIGKRELIRFMDYNMPTLLIIFVAVTGGEAVELAYTYLTGGLLMCFFTVYFLKDITVKKPNWEYIKSYWSFGLPSFFITFSSKLGRRFDIVMVQAFWSSVNVGYYAVGLRFAAMVNGIATSLVTVIFPTISKFHADSDWDKIRDLVKNSTRYLSLIIVPIVSFLIMFPDRIIIIFLSRDFLPAVTVMRIMAINSFFIVLIGPFKSVFNGINKPKLGAKLIVSANFLNLGLNFLLIPPSFNGIPLMGMKEIGAGLATLTSSIILLVLVYVFSRREAGVGFYKNIPTHLFSGMITGVLLYLLELHVLPIIRYYHLLLYGLLFIGCYLGILALVGEFDREDLDYFLDIVNPFEIWDYLKDEIRKK